MSLRYAAAAARAGTRRPPNTTPSSTLRFKSTTAAAQGGGGTGGGASSAGAAAAAKSARAEESQSSVPVAGALLAMTAAIGTVSAGAASVESATASSCPPFDARGQRYDQTTFSGRFSRMFLGCDPRLLLYTEEEVRRCAAMVKDADRLNSDAGRPAGVAATEMNRSLWEAHRIASAALHPDTGDLLPRPFRMSGYVPFNGPICVAMVASTSTPALLFWSWVNQSQNALVNYYNRNASSEMSNETLMKSYAAAVGSALAVAFGLATFVRRRFEPSRARALMKFVAFPSAVVASSLNCYIVRSPEMDTGVALVDAGGNDVLPGTTSKEAAKRGVHSTTASRALLQAPVYFLPPVLLSAFPPVRNLVARNPAMTVPITTYLLLVSFGFGLPATVAVFPQMSEIKAEDAEEEYQCLRDAEGRPYEKFWYNKGL